MALIAIGATGCLHLHPRRADLAPQVTFATLAAGLTDFEAMLAPPDPFYRTVWSGPAAGVAGAIQRADASGRPEWILLDAQGPGALTSFWIQRPDAAGELRIYLDDATSPTLQIGAAGWFSGQRTPFVAPLAGPIGDGAISWFPVPYGSRCIVATSADPGSFAIARRVYNADARVAPLRLPLSAGEENAVLAAASTLAGGSVSSKTDGAWTLSFQENIWPSGGVTSRTVLGSGEIHSIACRIAEGDLEAALRGVVIEMRYDDQAEPAVRAPLGDFFAAGSAKNFMASYPFSVGGDGTMTCRWLIPYHGRVEVRFINQTAGNISLSCEIIGVKKKWTAPNWYFHAAWKGAASIATRPFADWALPGPSGEGRLAALSLSVDNPLESWWGEGGIALQAGETSHTALISLPAFFGVGPGAVAPFGAAWLGQSRSDPTLPADQRGWRTMHRGMLLDDFPTSPGLKLAWRPEPRGDAPLAASATVYWYGPAETGGSPALPAELLDAAKFRVENAATTVALEGAIEAETLAAVASGGTTAVETSSRLGWSGGRQYLWRGAAPGDTLAFALPAPADGDYDVYLCATRELDGGRFTVQINDDPPGPPIDLAALNEELMLPLLLGKHALHAGENRATLRMVSPAQAGRGGSRVGLDYFALGLPPR